MIDSPSILIDVTRCTGCEKCIDACKEANDLGHDCLRPGQRSVDALSASRFSTILRKPDDTFVRQMCLHCLEPACVSACLVGAMKKTDAGPVIYDEDVCMGCRYCMLACPYGIPRYEWDKPTPLVRKCTFCYDRLKQGQLPACVEACPEKALTFGTRDEMLLEAKKRQRENPGRYRDHVFGEREAGGASVLYLSNISMNFLAWNNTVGDQPLPELTWNSLKKVPPTIAVMGGVMTGIYWIIGRRMKRAVQNGEADGPDSQATDTTPETTEMRDDS
ncbi:MAG: 4Fe-4S dicluster domain-containing protein [candidate division Zixibacteria bacterium]|nr:4Fe-4S dicluster domain-containing protein [candidate division Zixibacteria bacterium]